MRRKYLKGKKEPNINYGSVIKRKYDNSGDEENTVKMEKVECHL
jgi:hypothetical protein